VMLYELLTGVRPFAGGTPEALTVQILACDPTSPRSHTPAVDRSLETVVLKCLEKSPERRYANAEALADDLARSRRGEPIVARPMSWPRRTARALRRDPLVATAALGLALVVGLLALMWRSDPQRPLEEIERHWQTGQAVTLVDAADGARWWQWHAA